MGARGPLSPQAQILTTICPLWLQVFQNSKMIFSKFGVANQIGVKKDKLSSFLVRHLFLQKPAPPTYGSCSSLPTPDDTSSGTVDSVMLNGFCPISLHYGVKTHTCIVSKLAPVAI